VRHKTALVLAGCLFSVAGVSRAQTLSSRPALFADPVLAVDPAHGELVLGRTTLRSALRIFATELQDSVQVPLGHPGNPDTISVAPSPGTPLGPPLRFRLDVGAGRYTLFFDKNERLVGVEAAQANLSRPLRREDLVARYATLRPLSSPDALGNLEASLGPCISMVAWARDSQILSFGYRFTCNTSPAEHQPVASVGR
jgi:hypothetical protein